MIKKVNVYPVYPILSIRNPIVHTTLNVELSVGDIERCIYGRAKVEEILPNGKIVVLNLKNYNKCNFEEEHINNLVASLPENENEEDTINLVKELEGDSEAKEATENEKVESLETISPAEVTVEEEQTSEVEENLVVDNNNYKKNKKNKK